MTDVVVSVVIPVHNQTGTLCQAVDSALCQDVALEVIVVDDASTVDVRQVLAPYMSEGRDRACEEGKDGARKDREVFQGAEKEMKLEPPAGPGSREREAKHETTKGKPVRLPLFVRFGCF